MIHANRALLAALMIAVLSAAGAALAGEGHDHAGHGHGEEPHPMEMDMELWMKMASPGDHHDHLSKLVGTWNAKVKMWMAPGAPPQESSGKAVNEMILGGRFLQTTYEGNFMGRPFQGMALDGYDNSAKRHVGMWMDNFGTHVMQFAGACEENGRVRTMTAEYLDPTGTHKLQSKGVTTVISDDEHRYEMYNILPDGTEMKGLEITYTRQ